MEESLYCISDVTYAVGLAIILWHTYVYRDVVSPVEKSFRRLLSWCVFFCLQDAFWGFTSLKSVGDRDLFFTASSIFHMSTIITANFWLDFVLTYLRNGVHHPKIYRILGFFMIALQLFLVVRNYFTPTIFSITPDHEYHTEFFRQVAFLNQYLLYVAVGIAMAIFFFRDKNQNKVKYFAVLMFVLAPLICGVFQLLYSYGPFNSIGYFIGCCIIHVFIVAHDRNERLITASNIDELTGIFNRRAYEEDFKKYKDAPIEEGLIIYSIDVNGLKQVNDSLGHLVGDELIVGAADCIANVLAGNGKVYRVGGDEFMAVINDGGDAKAIKERIMEESFRWRGNSIKELSLSIGYAKGEDFVGSDLVLMKKSADKMMYKDKEQYYLTKGVDRRGQREAFNAVCGSYTKILKVNLTKDSFTAIQLDPREKNADCGYSERISEWMINFAKQGLVHADETETFLICTDIEYLRYHFRTGKNAFSLTYKRRYEDGYHTVILEIHRADDYSDENQNVFLYVKDIDGVGK